MKRSTFTKWLVIAGVLNVGCQDQHDSITKDIVTDLGDGSAKRYWIELTAGQDSSAVYTIFQGMCGEGPLLPSNCANHVVSMDYEHFKVDLNNSLSQSIEDMKVEVSNTQDAILVTSEKLDHVQSELIRNEKNVGLQESEKIDLIELIDQFAIFVAEYQGQLQAASDYLSIYQDEDLLVLSKMLAIELEFTRNELVGYSNKLTAVNHAINLLLGLIEGNHLEISSLTKSLSDLEIVLNSQVLKLTELEIDFTFYESTLSRLELKGIMVRVTDTNEWQGHVGSESLFQDIKPFVRRFEEIMSSERLAAK